MIMRNKGSAFLSSKLHTISATSSQQRRARLWYRFFSGFLLATAWKRHGIAFFVPRPDDFGEEIQLLLLNCNSRQFVRCVHFWFRMFCSQFLGPENEYFKDHQVLSSAISVAHPIKHVWQHFDSCTSNNRNVVPAWSILCNYWYQNTK